MKPSYLEVNVPNSFTGSSTLAQQLALGAPADIFISADQDWSDYVAQQGLFINDSRRNLLGNQLVLIAPTKRAQQPKNLQQIQNLKLETADDLASNENQK